MYTESNLPTKADQNVKHNKDTTKEVPEVSNILGYIFMSSIFMKQRKAALSQKN